MASNYKPLNPNASPYHHNPHRFFVDPPHPYPYNHSPIFYTYNTHLQPIPRKPFPVFFPRPPSPTTAKKIHFSLTPVPSGPRIPKPRIRGRRRSMKWVPKVPDTKPTLNDVVVGIENNNKLRFQGTRWKNSRRGYQTVLPLEPDTTSLMIKNVPNKYTRELLIQTLDNHCEVENKKIKNGGVVSAFDFFYLPIDFTRRTNAGFAFVNFTSPDAALRFRDAFDGKRWNLFDSSKVAEITRARIQGKAALIDNCKGMDFSFGSEEDMPVWFAPARDGSGKVQSRMFMVGKSSWARMNLGN